MKGIASARYAAYCCKLGLFAVLLFASASAIQAQEASLVTVPSSADNFVLLDQNGDAHELYYNKNAQAIVLMAHGNGCQIVRSNLEELQQLATEFKPQGVEFYMLNANAQDKRADILAEAQEWGIQMPILKDRTQTIAKSLQIMRTGEVLVINPASRQIVYRGALSDRVDYERQKNSPSKRYVRDALTSVIAKQPIATQQVVAPGCIINYDTSFAQRTPISYAEDIAPILESNCTACHIEGGIAPWAMSEYAMVKGFSPMMREVLRTKRMPPWHSDPEIGHWEQSKALSDEDKRTLLQWIEAGTPRGDGDDPLRKIGPLVNQWTLGEPDLIIDIPAFEVPANGTVDYQFPVVKNPLDKDVWVIGAAIIPGDPKAVHHILAGSSEQAPLENDLGDIFENFILTYAPGNESNFMPEGTGVFVPKGGVYQFQMHYTPYGRETTDKSKIGLYFADKPPKNFYREHVLFNGRIRIPAEAPRHEEKAYFKFYQDATIHALFPHAHYRGRSSSFELIYPDGKKEMLLSVPNYDFNWQRSYTLSDPKNVPAGTRIVHRTIYDNSANNRGNPAPEEDVYWGLQSEQEMLYGSMGYTWTNETTDKPTHNRQASELSQLIGHWDQNMDDLLSLDELSERRRKQLAGQWANFDKDGDGYLNFDEFAGMMQKLSQSSGAE